MKRATIRRIACLTLCVCLFCSLIVSASAAEETPEFSFLAMSDLHLDDLLFQTCESNKKQFQKVVSAAGNLDLDAFIGGGDYSSYGFSLYWYMARCMVQKAGFDQSIWALGNHEYGTTGLRAFTWQKYRAFSGESELYFTREINGYTFIVLGAELGIPGTFGNMSTKQKDWFAKTLQEAAENADGKPVFVVSHFDLNTGNVRRNIAAEMAKYDNIIFLWGHMHDGEYTDMTLDQCIGSESGFTTARMGSVHYYNNKNADGMIVRVYKDRVELEMMRVSGSVLNPDTVTIALK